MRYITNTNSNISSSSSGNNNSVTSHAEEEINSDDSNNSEDVQEAFQEAVKIGDVEKVVSLLKTCRIDIDQPNWGDSATPPIIEVVRSGNVHLLKILCENGCDPNARSLRGETALHIAACHKRPSMEIVGVLISFGCNANIQENLRGETALHMFINRHIANGGSRSRRSLSSCSAEEEQQKMIVITEMFRTLVEHTDVDIMDYRYRTPVHMVASATFQYSPLNVLLQVLLDRKPNLSIQNGRGETALHEALENSNTEVAIAFIRAKADLYLETKYRETALHIAARKNLFKVVRALLEHDCPINMQDLNGNSALHLAAGRGYLSVVEVLLENEKTQLNISNKEGLTALHLAVESGFISVVELLLKADSCDLTAETKRCETPLDLAQQEYRRRSQPEMAEVLSRELQRRSCGKSL